MVTIFEDKATHGNATKHTRSEIYVSFEGSPAVSGSCYFAVINSVAWAQELFAWNQQAGNGILLCQSFNAFSAIVLACFGICTHDHPRSCKIHKFSSQ